MDDLCDVCGKREGENHDLPGRCRPEMAKISVVQLASLHAQLEDLAPALDAIEDVMSYDKGLPEEVWVDWCNDNLPLMQRHGRMKYTLGWS